MTDIREKIKEKIERDAKAFQMDEDAPKTGPANSYAIGASDWADRCMELVEAIRNDDCSCMRKVPKWAHCGPCRALEAFEKELELK